MSDWNKCKGAIPKKKTPTCLKYKLAYNWPKPDVATSVLKPKAIPEVRSRKLWYELGMPECTRHIFDGKMLSDSIPESLFCYMKSTRANRKLPTVKKKQKTYMQKRLEREAFRRKLVQLVSGKDEDIDMKSTLPPKDENELSRYYYYIKQGVDTIHVAPMSKRVLNRIKLLIPTVLHRWNIALSEIIQETKADYLYAMKKAVVDYVLDNPKHKDKKQKDSEVIKERAEAHTLFDRYRFRYEENRCKMMKTLFCIHRSVAMILELWSMKFKDFFFVDCKEMAKSEEAFMLFNFTVKFCILH